MALPRSFSRPQDPPRVNGVLSSPDGTKVTRQDLDRLETVVKTETEQRIVERVEGGDLIIGGGGGGGASLKLGTVVTFDTSALVAQVSFDDGSSGAAQSYVPAGLVPGDRVAVAGTADGSAVVGRLRPDEVWVPPTFYAPADSGSSPWIQSGLANPLYAAAVRVSSVSSIRAIRWWFASPDATNELGYGSNAIVGSGADRVAIFDPTSATSVATSAPGSGVMWAAGWAGRIYIARGVWSESHNNYNANCALWMFTEAGVWVNLGLTVSAYAPPTIAHGRLWVGLKQTVAAPTTRVLSVDAAHSQTFHTIDASRAAQAFVMASEQQDLTAWSYDGGSNTVQGTNDLRLMRLDGSGTVVAATTTQLPIEALVAGQDAFGDVWVLEHVQRRLHRVVVGVGIVESWNDVLPLGIDQGQPNNAFDLRPQRAVLADGPSVVFTGMVRMDAAGFSAPGADGSPVTDYWAPAMWRLDCVSRALTRIWTGEEHATKLLTGAGNVTPRVGAPNPSPVDRHNITLGVSAFAGSSNAYFGAGSALMGTFLYRFSI